MAERGDQPGHPRGPHGRHRRGKVRQQPVHRGPGGARGSRLVQPRRQHLGSRRAARLQPSARDRTRPCNLRHREQRRGRGLCHLERPRQPARAWVSTDGSSWTAATFTPTPPSGSSTTVEGCLPTGGGFLAYGESTGAGQVELPQLWTSSDGTLWQQQPATFTGPSGGRPSGPQSAPLDGIATGTTTWLGLSGDGDEPSQVWPAPVGGAAGAQFTPAGLWTSEDAGNTWQQLGTLTPAFTGMVYAQADAAAYVGQQPVVAGTVDGQLAVWVGTPTASNPSAGGTTGVTTATTGATATTAMRRAVTTATTAASAT